MNIEGLASGLASGAVAAAVAARNSALTEVGAAIDLARTGSPVDQGNALRAIDATTGDRRASDAMVAGEATATSAASAAPEVCTVEVRFKPVVGPTNHAFIVTSDSDSTNYFRGGPQANNTGSNSPSSGSSSSSGGGAERAPYDSRYGVYGPIVTEYGAYRPGTVDWTTDPSGQQTIDRIAGNCDAIESQFARHMNDIEAAGINYMPLAANSNSTVRETLERSGYPDVSPIVWSPAWNAQLPLPR